MKRALTFTLSTCSRKEIRAKSASHDLVELLNTKLVSVDFLDLAFSLADGSGTTKS
jgi:hypothetical protein